MQVTAAIKKQVETKIKDCIRIAEAHYKKKFAYPSSVSYTIRGSTAGIARPSAWTVEFNPVLLMENVADFIARTVPHEMAHLFDFQLNPEGHQGGLTVDRHGRYRRKKRDIHGYSWKSVMHVLGADASRCHSYDVTTVKINSPKSHHVWVCRDCGTRMLLGPARHKKMHTGATRYWKRGCGHHGGGYEYAGLVGQEKQVTKATSVSAIMPPPAPAPKAVVPRAVAHPAPSPLAPRPWLSRWLRGTSKLDRCRAVYDDTSSREHNIQLFITIGCTPAGAATYYAKIKKEG